MCAHFTQNEGNGEKIKRSGTQDIEKGRAMKIEGGEVRQLMNVKKLSWGGSF